MERGIVSIQRESKHESYDAIVIGSGMGGLSVAGLLAKAGKAVLVVERHDRPGGYAHSFNRKKYKFDSAVHMISGCEPLSIGWGALIDDLLDLLGVRERVNFLRVDPFYGAFYPDLHFEGPTGVMEFIEAHARLFPQEARALKQFMRLCTKINLEIFLFEPDATSYETLREPEKYPLHAQFRDTTLAEVLDAYFTDPQLKALLATPWSYQGLPPSQLSILKFSPMLISYLSTGAFYPEGGMQAMVNALVEGIERHGGEVLLRSSVRRVMVQDGRATGIILENGQRIQTPIVVSNADARQTFEELVGPEDLPSSFLCDLRAMRPSLSATMLYMATDLDLHQIPGLAHETFVFESWDHDAIYRGLLAGRPDVFLLSMPTLLDPSVAPPGEHLVTAMTLIPFDHSRSWREDKPEMMERLLARAERVLPGLRDHITFMEGASPRTMERFTLNHLGAIYGWEQSPKQAGANRLSRVTPIDGLYLSGHWTQPGGGAVTAAGSGAQTAQLLLGYPTVRAMFGALGG
ncbi:MAG: NAD(P)/FAD-dependent oxidoreductase [Thermomicrobiales bacterium]